MMLSYAVNIKFFSVFFTECVSVGGQGVIVHDKINLWVLLYTRNVQTWDNSYQTLK